MPDVKELKDKKLENVSGGNLDNIARPAKNDSEGLDALVGCVSPEEELGGKIHVTPTVEHITPFFNEDK